MNYFVRVKMGHPTGVRRRSGMTFTREEQRLSEAQLTKEICEDPWLEGRAVEEEISIPGGVTPPITEPPPGNAPASDETRPLVVEGDAGQAAGEPSAAPDGAADQKPASDEAAASEGKNGDGREGRKKRTH